jgi:hypothetical protein
MTSTTDKHAWPPRKKTIGWTIPAKRKFFDLLSEVTKNNDTYPTIRVFRRYIIIFIYIYIPTIKSNSLQRLSNEWKSLMKTRYAYGTVCYASGRASTGRRRWKVRPERVTQTKMFKTYGTRVHTCATIQKTY